MTCDIALCCAGLVAFGTAEGVGANVVGDCCGVATVEGDLGVGEFVD